MDTISIPRDFAEELMTALNFIRNQKTSGERWRTTYDLAAELSRVLKSQNSRK